MNIPYTENAVPHMRGELLWYSFPLLDAYSDRLNHGFSTRLGGVSEGALASLNLGLGRGDDLQKVRENYRLWGEAAGFDADKTVISQQTHGVALRKVSRKDEGKGLLRERDYHDIDGLYTDQSGPVLITTYADCTPLLFYAPDRHIAATSHAGWRGTAAGIACKTVEEMCRIGAQPKAIQAAIGPCIHNCCYEVSLDFYDEVERLCGRTFANRYITPYPARAEKAPRELILNPPDRTESPKYRADLVGMNLHMLRSVGMAEAHINICAACTCCQSTLYFSHRATGGKRGTMAAIISL